MSDHANCHDRTHDHQERPPTAKQLAVYRFIEQYCFRHHTSPTIRAIGHEFGISSPNGVMSHIRGLLKKGLLRRVRIDGRDRSSYVPADSHFVSELVNADYIRVGTTGTIILRKDEYATWLREQLAGLNVEVVA